MSLFLPCQCSILLDCLNFNATPSVGEGYKEGGGRI